MTEKIDRSAAAAGDAAGRSAGSADLASDMRPRVNALNSIANPIAAIWSGALMLEFLGQEQVAGALLRAVETTLRRGAVRTPDLGGQATTRDMAAAVIGHLG